MTGIEKRIKELMEEYSQLNREKFLSDQELQRKEEIIKEIDELNEKLNQEAFKDSFNGHDELAQVENQLDQEEKTDDEPTNELEMIKKQQKELAQELQLEKERVKLAEMQQSLQELRKESGYITSLKDEKGYIKVNESKYQAKMKLLEAELKNANGFREKMNVRSKILDLKATKAMVKMNNATIKIGRGSIKAAETIRELSDGLSQLGNYSTFESRKNNNTKQKRHKKHKKKSKSRKNSNNYRNDKPDDYGFNPDTFFK